MKIAVSGATGRMGKLIIEAVLCSDDLELAAAVTAPGVPEIGTDAGAAIGKTTEILISDDVQEIAKADVLIDFTRPQATLAYLPFCVAHNVGVVIGTNTTVKSLKCTTSTRWMPLPARPLKWGAVLHRDAALISIRLQFSVERVIPGNVPMVPSVLPLCAAETLSVTIR